VPVVFGEVDDDWNQDREGLALVVLQDREEEIVLKEAHGSVRNLEMRAGNGLDESLEQLLDVRLELGDVTDVQDLEQFLQEHGFLSEVGERPVSEESLHELSKLGEKNGC
jgi:hypothetical protein